MKIRQIILKGVRNFDDFHYCFEDSWTETIPDSLLLMGASGSGKTTLLKAIYELWRIFQYLLSTLSENPSLSVLAECKFAAMEIIGLFSNPLWIVLGDEIEARNLLCNSDYAAIVTKEKRIRDFPLTDVTDDLPRVMMPDNELVVAHVHIQDDLHYLKEKYPVKHEEVLAVNKKLIGKEIIDSEYTDVKIKPGKVHPVHLLSSGEQQILLTLSYLARWLRPGCVVLIDEPDLHLHTSLRNAFVSHLRQMISQQQGQLIISSHAPELWERFTKAEKVRLNRLRW